MAIQLLRPFQDFVRQFSDFFNLLFSLTFCGLSKKRPAVAGRTGEGLSAGCPDFINKVIHRFCG
jgi:hypothetical protein